MYSENLDSDVGNLSTGIVRKYVARLYEIKNSIEKVVKDYGKVIREFQAWWDINSKEHNWEGSNWYVNFQKKQVLCKG